MNEKLELIIREKYADLRKSEKRAADYLLQYEGDGRTLTLEQFADGANVSQPTVLRFFRALGYKGFKDFRYVLAQKEPEEKENGYFLYGSTVMEGDTISELPAKLIGTSIGQLKDTLKKSVCGGAGKGSDGNHKGQKDRGLLCGELGLHGQRSGHETGVSGYQLLLLF